MRPGPLPWSPSSRRCLVPGTGPHPDKAWTCLAPWLPVSGQRQDERPRASRLAPWLPAPGPGSTSLVATAAAMTRRTPKGPEPPRAMVAITRSRARLPRAAAAITRSRAGRYSGSGILRSTCLSVGGFSPYSMITVTGVRSGPSRTSPLTCGFAAKYRESMTLRSIRLKRS